MTDFMARQMAEMLRRIADLERRLENSHRMGKVEEVDTEKGLVRLKIGKGPDGTDQLSPWRPYAQIAGGLKVHSPPTKGQNMVMVSPNGDLEQAFALPLTWNKENEAPSKKGTENVMTFGDATVAVRGSEIEVTVPTVKFNCGGVTFTLSGDGLKQDGGDQVHEGGSRIHTGGTEEHNGKNVGSSHIHTGVLPGPATTGPPA